MGNVCNCSDLFLKEGETLVKTPTPPEEEGEDETEAERPAPPERESFITDLKERGESGDTPAK